MLTAYFKVSSCGHLQNKTHLLLVRNVSQQKDSYPRLKTRAHRFNQPCFQGTLKALNCQAVAKSTKPFKMNANLAGLESSSRLLTHTKEPGESRKIQLLICLWRNGINVPNLTSVTQINQRSWTKSSVHSSEAVMSSSKLPNKQNKTRPKHTKRAIGRNSPQPNTHSVSFKTPDKLT